MKIYSSELLNDTQVDAGSLAITNDDLLTIQDLSDIVLSTNSTTGVQSVMTNATQGMQILDGSLDTVIGATDTTTLADGGVAYHYISGTGAEKDLADVLIAQGSLSGSNLQLSNAAGLQLVANISLAGLMTGGGSAGAAATNPMNNDLPVKYQDDLGENVFVDSVIAETGTFVTPTTTTGAIVGAVTSGSTANIDGIPAGDRTAFDTRFSAGVAGTSIIIGGITYTGTLTSTASGATATFSLASGTFSGANELADNAVVTLPLVAAERTVTGLSLLDGVTNGTVVIHGGLQVTGSTTSTNSHQVEFNDSFLVLNSVAGNPADFSAINGGLIFTTDHTNAGDSYIYSGIRYNATSDQFEIAHNLNIDDGSGSTGTDPNALNTWVPLSTAIGSTQKAAVTIAGLQAGSTGTPTATFNGNTTADTADITVTAPAAGSGAVTVAIVIQGDNTLLPINSDDVTVNVYEDGSMIIPDGISVVESSGVTTVTITLPDGYASAAAVSLKTVIVG